MARWKLAAPHYIHSADTEWEYTEVDRTTGRNVRRKFPVPRLLDPRDPGDWNNKWGSKDTQEGEIIVCREGKGEPRDYVFTGDPTPDMIPMDEEAEAESAKFATQWSYKPDSDMPGNFSQSLVDKFQSQMSEVVSKPVQIEGISELIAAITLSTKQNAELIESAIKRRA